MSDLNQAAAPAELLRNVFLTKGSWVGAFWLVCNARFNRVWTFDPRIVPMYHWFDYQTQEMAEKRLDELVHISLDNGWHVGYAGERNGG